MIRAESHTLQCRCRQEFRSLVLFEELFREDSKGKPDRVRMIRYTILGTSCYYLWSHRLVWSGHDPLKVKTPVQIRLGSLLQIFWGYVWLVDLGVRFPICCWLQGRGFDSL